MFDCHKESLVDALDTELLSYVQKVKREKDVFLDAIFILVMKGSQIKNFKEEALKNTSQLFWDVWNLFEECKHGSLNLALSSRILSQVY